MNNNPVSTTPQTTSINIQVPTLDSLATKPLLIPLGFLLVILLFFFTYCDFKIVGASGESEYSSNSQTGKSITGFNFITGTALPMAAVNNQFVSGFLGIKEETANNLQKISFNIWALLALAAAIAGLYIYLKKESNQSSLYTILLSALGILSLLLLLVSSKKYEQSIDLGIATLQTKMSFQFSYWLSLLCFITSGIISYARLKLKSQTEILTADNPPTPIHVSIITQDADATKGV